MQYGSLVNRRRKRWANARKIMSGMTTPELWDMRFRSQAEVWVDACYGRERLTRFFVGLFTWAALAPVAPVF